MAKAFDKAHYSSEKKAVIELIKADLRSSGGFIADGVICPEIFERQEDRILCILAESYGYDNCEMKDIEDQGESDLLGLDNHSVKTPRRLGVLLHLLQRSFETRAQISPDEWKGFPWLLSPRKESADVLQTVFSKIAWINVKKASKGNGTRLSSAECREHAFRNKEILRRQIASTAPTLILIGGEIVFSSLYELGVLGTEVSLGRKWELQGRDHEPQVIEMTHPGWLKWRSYDYIYDRYNCIYAQMTRGVKVVR